MSTVKLLNNLPIEELTPETDYLGLIDKGELIKTFLIGNKEQFNEIKMFSLYGEWGSGKSSLMKYLQKELRDDFNTFFFEAWEFEKDENLAMSLLEFITAKSTDAGDEIYNDILKYGGRILRGLGKSIKFNIAGVEVEPSALVGELTKEEELTFYKALEKFKTEFRRLEDNITRKDKKYNIVFIDDLDRCEPEQVLNLLSAIKLFFTYGQKTIFFCGIDKKAAEEAVKTKYGEVVKSNEYLEKIFDISFTMPKHEDVLKLLKVYFNDTPYPAIENKPIYEELNRFFRAINFTNPRRVKKVLNKYQILRGVIFGYRSDFYMAHKKNIEIKDPMTGVPIDNILNRLTIPNIDMKDIQVNSVLETILVLYLIILHEFYPDSFIDFLNFEKKRVNLNKINDTSNLSLMSTIMEPIFLKKYPNNRVVQNEFLCVVCPVNFENVIHNSNKTISKESVFQMIQGYEIEYLFFTFISSNMDLLNKDSGISKSSFQWIKNLVRNAV